MSVSITKPCGRCGGTGQYSYNQVHGTMCYGCSGKGVVLDRKAAKRAGVNVVATAELKTCKVGDTIEVQKLPYVVESIVWKQIGLNGVEFSLSDKFWSNQIVKVRCLVDEKKYKLYRTVFDEQRLAIEVDEAQVGQEATIETWLTSGTSTRR